MSSGKKALSPTGRQPFGRIRTLPEARIGLIEVLSIAVACAEASDEKEEFARVRDLMHDIIAVVNESGSVAKLGNYE